MKIISATYGGVDVKSIVESKIKGDALVLRSSNANFGDTMVGVKKTLKIEGESNGVIFNEEVEEGGLFQYPKSENDRLGIFYSNNVKAETNHTIIKSLNEIKRASEGIADILTCMWRHEPQNPFIEHIAWTQTQSHLNQLLQIMQLLYSAREMKKYKYVSFLEHDVLYASGYFEFPDFQRGEILTNMNYIGMNRNGFQPLGQRDEPFHQMTMHFDDAIAHCERILPNALITNSGMIEAQDMKRTQWESTFSNIHVNHGHHFTSHFNVFRTDGYYSIAPYWGNHNDYLYLFNT